MNVREQQPGESLPTSRKTLRGYAVCVIAVLVVIVAAPDNVWSSQDPSTEIENKEEKEKKDLGDRLVRKTVSESDEDIMAEILRLMTESARRLEIEYDPGEETVAVQDTIMRRLQDAIKQAAAQRRPRQSSDPQAHPDKRTGQSSGKDQSGDRSASGDSSKPAESDSSTTSGSDAADTRSSDGQLGESRRTWGQLPQRERDAVIQGSGEKFLQRYREIIERYYRALQEADEDR